MEHFTPVASALGGALIGLSAAILWLADGRIAGISGIMGNLPTSNARDAAWRLAFMIGLVAAPLLYAALIAVPPIAISAGTGRLIAAGLLVGFGTRLGSGCTSGHGVCGLARLSKRSMMATVTFMETAIIVVYVIRHVLGG